MKQSAIAVLLAALSGLTQAATGLDCMAALRSSKEIEAIGNRVTVGARPTLAQMSDSTKPTEDQRPAIDALASGYDRCLELTTKELGAQIPGSAPAFVALGAELRTAFLALYKGETTFGQFNTRYNELRSDIDRKLAELRERSGVKGSDSSAPVARNTLQQDLYQCEQEAARSYPPQMVQVMTSPGFQAAPSPMQTNCTSLSNQINCTSGSRPSIYNTPPTYITKDANLVNRAASARSCMLARGYTPN